MFQIPCRISSIESGSLSWRSPVIPQEIVSKISLGLQSYLLRRYDWTQQWHPPQSHLLIEGIWSPRVCQSSYHEIDLGPSSPAPCEKPRKSDGLQPIWATASYLFVLSHADSGLPVAALYMLRSRFFPKPFCFPRVRDASPKSPGRPLPPPPPLPVGDSEGPWFKM